MAKYCPECYVGVSLEDAVCKNCGHVLKEITPTEITEENENTEPLDIQSLDKDQTEVGLSEERTDLTEKLEVPIFQSEWILTFLLLLIPVVNIILLIVWSVSSNTKISKKYFARATLIFSAVVIVFALLFSAIVYVIQTLM